MQHIDQGTHLTWIVSAEHDGMKLVGCGPKILTPIIPSRSKVEAACDKGHLFLNGVPARFSDRVHPGDRLELRISPAEQARQLYPRGILDACRVLFADAHLAIVYKPPGLGAAGGPTGAKPTLEGALPLILPPPTDSALPAAAGATPLPRPIVLYTLEKASSGPLLVARTAQARAGILSAGAAGAVELTFAAIVYGFVPPGDGGWRRLDTLEPLLLLPPLPPPRASDPASVRDQAGSSPGQGDSDGADSAEAGGGGGGGGSGGGGSSLPEDAVEAADDVADTAGEGEGETDGADGGGEGAPPTLFRYARGRARAGAHLRARAYGWRPVRPYTHARACTHTHAHTHAQAGRQCTHARTIARTHAQSHKHANAVGFVYPGAYTRIRTEIHITR
jgi:hypothetical protein